MDKRYEAYCVADPVFYENPSAGPRAARTRLALDGREPPADWQLAEDDEWRMLAPPGHRLPPQGWKIHVSACLDNAERVLHAVWDHCAATGTAFKYVPSKQAFLLRNAKYAPRGGSGKLITVYPADETAFEVLIKDLAALLEGEPGPYILSDLRIGEGPVYVRYGGFAERLQVSERGELVPAIARPDGTLVPDPRRPVFSVPEWVTPPECLAPHLEARGRTTLAGLPYEARRALHFSNGGGVYLAVDTRTGDEVVLKEGRPYAGLSGDGADAVARLERERTVLTALAGLDVVPAVLDHFELGGHHFLVEEYVDGRPLQDLITERYPLIRAGADAEACAAYATWALGMAETVERAVAALHARGVVFGDVHPYNVLVRPDGRVVLIDFEVAVTDADTVPTLGHPGYAAPRDRSGTALDLHSLACLRLALFLPLTTLLQLDPGKAGHIAAVIGERFPVPPEFLAEAVRRIEGPGGPRPPVTGTAYTHPATLLKTGTAPAGEGPAELPAWEPLRDALRTAIDASATPGRADRLFPGDVEQFFTGGIGLAHGAAGVLYALHATGAGHRPEHEEWLLDRALHPPEGTRLGLYDGLAGAAYVLDLLGHPGEARDVLRSCLAERWQALGGDLQGGLSGLALVTDHLTGGARPCDTVLAMARLVAERLGEPDDVPATSGGDNPYAGLMRGSSGPALLFIRLYERTGEPAWLDLAGTALRQDLRRCRIRPDEDVLHVDEGWRTLPYLARGSAGIGLVLAERLAYRPDEELAAAAYRIRRAALAPFYIQPGLFGGAAGLLLYLARCGPRDDPAVSGLLSRLSWHALGYGGGLAFPGDQLLRLSMDLATGSAGVLLAAGAVLGREPAGLPFLPHGLGGATTSHPRGGNDGPS
ncbi:MAG: phosphotransferase [Streptosporangiales bacterium]|nr:phosphotransferase [Streptosporangiales bacterium]